jgi:hypothetical protein
MKLGGGGYSFPTDDPFFNIAADRVDRDGVSERQEAGRQRFVLAHQTQQYVLRRDDLRAILESLIPSEKDDPPRPLRVPFKHKNKSRVFRYLRIITKNRTALPNKLDLKDYELAEINSESPAKSTNIVNNLRERAKNVCETSIGQRRSRLDRSVIVADLFYDRRFARL